MRVAWHAENQQQPQGESRSNREGSDILWVFEAHDPLIIAEAAEHRSHQLRFTVPDTVPVQIPGIKAGTRSGV